MNSQPGQTELETNHLPLLGDPETAVNRARRLGQNCPVGRPTASANGTAPTMEQGQMDTILAGNVGKFLLGLILGPRRHQLTRILGGIRVADHHFLTALAILPVPFNLVQSRHAVRRATQVVQGFKQRDDPHRKLHPRFPQQQNHAQHVGGLAGHANHVGAESFRGLLRHYLAGRQHLGNGFRGLPIAGDQRTSAL